MLQRDLAVPFFFALAVCENRLTPTSRCQWLAAVNGGGVVMKLPLPDANKVKALLAAVEEHPVGAILVTLFVTAIVYVWRH